MGCLEGFVTHTLQPVYDKNSNVLILGTIPSPKSREYGFYYGHPQNRFWKVLSALFQAEIPIDNEAKKQFVLSRHIALWDVLASCTISGASDSSIKNPIPNDIGRILSEANIRSVITTGQKAFALYQRYCEPSTHRKAICLPSTSPANCRNYDLEDLIQAYQVILRFLS